MSLMRISFRFLTTTVAGLVFSAATFAQAKSDESCLLITTGGAKFQGVIAKSSKDEVVLETALGKRKFPAAVVAERAPIAPLKEAFERRLKVMKQSKQELGAREALAIFCRDEGYLDGYAALVESILAEDPTNAKVRAWMDDDARNYELVRNDQPQDKGRWAREEIDLLFTKLEKSTWAEAGIARAQLEALDDELLLGPAVKFTKGGSAQRRWVAASLLGRTKDVRRVKPLYQRALSDPASIVRREAVASLKKTAQGPLIGPFVGALLTNENAAVRVFAAEALGDVGDKAAVKPLVDALAAAADGARQSPHQNISVLNQIAYVKDFDVEVAQSAFIADPIVDIVQDGVVLDASLISIGMQRRVIGRALSRLTGKDHGGDVKAWRSEIEAAAQKN